MHVDLMRININLNILRIEKKREQGIILFTTSSVWWLTNDFENCFWHIISSKNIKTNKKHMHSYSIGMYANV